jgi:hypothetical protein
MQATTEVKTSRHAGPGRLQRSSHSEPEENAATDAATAVVDQLAV